MLAGSAGVAYFGCQAPRPEARQAREAGWHLYSPVPEREASQHTRHKAWYLLPPGEGFW